MNKIVDIVLVAAMLAAAIPPTAAETPAGEPASQGIADAGVDNSESERVYFPEMTAPE